MRKAGDMTVEQFKAHLEQKKDEVLHFDKYRVGQRRVTRTQPATLRIFPFRRRTSIGIT